MARWNWRYSRREQYCCLLVKYTSKPIHCLFDVQGVRSDLWNLVDQWHGLSKLLREGELQHRGRRKGQLSGLKAVKAVRMQELIRIIHDPSPTNGIFLRCHLEKEAQFRPRHHSALKSTDTTCYAPSTFGASSKTGMQGGLAAGLDVFANQTSRCRHDFMISSPLSRPSDEGPTGPITRSGNRQQCKDFFMTGIMI